MKSLDQLRAEHLERKKLVEEAKAALARLPRDAYREVVLDAMVELDAEIADGSRAAATAVPVSPRRRNVIAMRYGKKARAKARAKVKMTWREAVTKVLANGAALATGAVVEEIRVFLPDAPYPSIASEIKRMKGEGLLEERGRNDTGHALYALVASAKEGTR